MSVDFPTKQRPRIPIFPPINLAKFCEENKASLTPPVCNKLIYGDGEFKIQVRERKP